MRLAPEAQIDCYRKLLLGWATCNDITISKLSEANGLSRNIREEGTLAGLAVWGVLVPPPCFISALTMLLASGIGGFKTPLSLVARDVTGCCMASPRLW